MPEYRKLVKQFNDTGVILMRHEVDVQTAWLNRNPSIRDMEKKMAMPVLRKLGIQPLTAHYQTLRVTICG